jgi:CBS domain-containing membrane protein
MRRHREIRVEELMTTAVIAVRAGDSLEAARQQMEMAGIRHLPVVDDAQQVIGILSDRDLLRAVGGRVGAHMTSDVVTVSPSSSAADAATRMQELKIGSLPVVSDDQRLVGMVTETDFLAVAARALRGLAPLDRS